MPTGININVLSVAGPVYISEYDYPVKLTFAGQLF